MFCVTLLMADKNRRLESKLWLKMKSDQIKNGVLRFFRFNRGYYFCATELFDEDLVLSNGNSLIFVEVKTTWSDYCRESKKIKYRGDNYTHLEMHINIPQIHRPNQVYFATPLELAIKMYDQACSNYGLISHTGAGIIAVNKRGVCDILLQAEEKNKEKVADVTLDKIIKRMSSEIISLREKSV